MTTLTRPHPVFTVAWLLAHGFGLACFFIPTQLWAWYYYVVAAIELLALGATWLFQRSGFTWSSHMWWWVHDRFGRTRGWVAFLETAWTVVFVGVFMAVQPWTGTGLDAFVGILFGVWLAGGHFVHNRVRYGAGPHG